MTSPAAIAQRLTPAHVRALKEPNGCSRDDFVAFAEFHFQLRGKKLVAAGRHTELGLAVITELERMGK